MVRAKTLAVVAGLTVCTMSLAMAGPGRFVHHTLVVLGFDDSQPAATPQELLRKGIDDYRWGRYDDAGKAFAQASKLPGLSEREQEILAQYRALLLRVNKSRQEASELLSSAQRALQQGDLKQAESLATTVAANGNASADDREEAKAILLRLQTPASAPASKPSADVASRRDAQQLITQARQALQQGNLDEAESLALQADSYKLNYGRLEDTPARVLQEVADARATNSKSPSSSTVVGNPKARAKAMVAEANSSLKRNELDRAEQLARQAKELNAKFYMYENSPDDVLAAVQRARRQRGTAAAANAQPQSPTPKLERVATPSEPTTSARPSSQVPVASTETAHDDAISISNPAANSAIAAATEETGSAEQTLAQNEAPAFEETVQPAAATSGPSDAVASESASPFANDQAKSEVRQMLAQARKLIETGHLDEAEQIVSQAESQDVQWGPFDNPVQGTRRELAVARNQAAKAGGEPVEDSQVSNSSFSMATDSRKDALKLLRQGRIYLRAGELDQAEEMARQAAELNASFRLLDDTPRQLSADIVRASAERNSVVSVQERSAAGETVAPEVADVPSTRPSGTSKDVGKQAQAYLKKAREQLDRGEYDSAIEIAHRVQSWGLSYGFWDDTPAKVESAAKTMKSRAVARASSTSKQRAQRLVAQPAAPTQRSDVVQTSHAAPVHTPLTQTPAQRPSSEPVFTEPPPEAVEWLAGATSVPLSMPDRNGTTGSRVARQATPVIQTEAQLDETGPTLETAEHVTVAPAASDEQKLEMARELFERGNYPRARDRAVEVYNSNSSFKPQADELITRANVAEQTATYQLYEAGVAAARKGQYTRALAFFQQVYASGVELDPSTDQQLRSYLRDLPGRVGTASRPERATVTVADGNVQIPILNDAQDSSDIGQRERAKFQQLVTETNHKVQAAKLLLQSNPAQAIRDLESAQDAIRSSGLDVSMTEPLIRRLEAAIRYASQEKQRGEVERVQNQSRDAADAQRKRQLATDQHKQQEVFELIEKGNAALHEARYQDAELAAKKALEVDPDNRAAIALQFKAKIEYRLQQQQDLQELKNERILDTLKSVDDSAVPFGNDNELTMRFPDAKRWEDLTTSRKRRFEGIEKGIRSPKELEIERKLSEPISINFTETPLSDVVAFLHDATTVNVVLDKHALAVDGISSDKPITMKIENIPLRSVLKLILGQMDLDYLIQNDVLLITTPLKKQGDMTAKSYFVGDLVVPISAFPGANVGGPNPRNPGGTIGFGPGVPGNNLPPGGMPMPNAALAQIGTGIGGTPPLTSGGNMLPGYSNGSGVVGTPPGGMGTGQIVDFDSLIQLVEQTISPNSWSSVGGAGTIQPFQPNLSLVVNQTQAVHEQISDLLTQLRRLQDLQVTVEVKFITLTEDFFERIGIDFDMDIQSNASKPLRSFGQIIDPGGFVAGGGGGGGGQAQQFNQPTLNLIYHDHDDDVAVGVGQPRGANGLAATGLPVFTPDLKIPFRTGGFGNGRPSGFVQGDGLSFGIAFLSDIEVFLFLEAAQQNNRGNVLTAPKVTLFNGQFALVFSGSVEPFVTAVNPIVAAGSVAFNPTFQQFFNGAFLGVQAVISADRRYVRLSLFPNFTNITGEKRFTVTGAAGGFGGVGGGGGAATAQAEIVVPIVSTNFVFTTVSVPDGGTVMMGGLKSKSEIRNEFGTPILNKIPYVQRLFMNTGVSSLTRSLLLMVTPRIIIQEEEEELLGKTVAF